MGDSGRLFHLKQIEKTFSWPQSPVSNSFPSYE